MCVHHVIVSVCAYARMRGYAPSKKLLGSQDWDPAASKTAPCCRRDTPVLDAAPTTHPPQRYVYYRPILPLLYRHSLPRRSPSEMGV